MNATPRGLAVEMSVPRRALTEFVQLAKPGVVFMVLVTAVVGFYLGSDQRPDLFLLGGTLLGVGAAAAGTLALNQYMERDLDARMHRTRERPLPSGRLQPLDALLFGAVLTAAGLLILCFAVNVRSGFVTALTVVSYLGLYTPLKRRTPLCSLIGAVPGALPPVAGWAAATNNLGVGAWVLFAILFFWQLPHSLAIARLYADDYARAGFRLLPVVDRDGRSTERQIFANCLALLVVALLPTLLGMTGGLYFVSSLVLGIGFLICGALTVTSRSLAASRRVLLASLVYLPLLLGFMAADKL
jgi:protoheme IX farnesyltransferase